MILFRPEIEWIIHNKLVYENQQTLSREDQVFSRKEHMQKVKMQSSSLDFFFGCTKGISGSETIQTECSRVLCGGHLAFFTFRVAITFTIACTWRRKYTPNYIVNSGD